jgi:glycosyltransferase involved in cell wall biosynthesis
MLAYFIGKFFGQYPRHLDKKCVKNAMRIMVNSLMVQKMVKEIYNRIGEVYYPAIDSVFFDSERSFKGDYILACGRIVPLKRFDYLIEACANQDVRIVFAGQENKMEKKCLKDLSKRLNVKIEFLGAVDKKELKDIYANAKLVVLTCPKEYFGLVPVEAMATGTPVVAWADDAGPQETIVDGKTGYLAQPYSIADMSDKIAIALQKKWNKNKIKKHAMSFSENSLKNKFLYEINGLEMVK